MSISTVLWKRSVTNAIKKQRFVKFLLFLHFIAIGKFELPEILVLSRWRNSCIQAPHIQSPVRFCRFKIVQTSQSRGQHLCSKFTKIPHLECPRTFKVPTSSHAPPLGNNIDSCIATTYEVSFSCFSICRTVWKKRGLSLGYPTKASASQSLLHSLIYRWWIEIYICKSRVNSHASCTLHANFLKINFLSILLSL